MNQTFIRQYTLGILRFNSSDRGYYWCQMVVNNMLLSPSPYGHIYRSQCAPLNTICSLNQPICAHNLNGLQFIAYALTNSSYNCFLQEFHAARNTASTVVYDTSQSTDKMTLTTMSPTVSREGLSCDLSRSYVCAVGIVSGLVVLILSSLMAMVLCFLFIRKNRRHQGMNTIICYSIIIPLFNIISRKHEPWS